MAESSTVSDPIEPDTYSFKSVGDLRTDPVFTKEVDLTPIGIKTPLEFDSEIGGPFRMHFTLQEQVHDNFRNLILTNHGERLGNYYFGANLRELCLEFVSKQDFDSEAMLRIKSATKRSMPYIELDTFRSNITNQVRSESRPHSMALLSIKIFYSVPRLKINQKALEVLLYIAG